MCADPRSQEPAAEEKLYDIDMPGPSGMDIVIFLFLVIPGLVVAALFLLGAILALAESTGSPAVGWMTFIALILVIAAWAAFVSTPRLKRSIKASIDASRPDEIAAAMEAHFEHRKWRPGNLTGFFLSTMAKAGRVGVTIRACKKAQREHIKPIHVRFEPIPLNEADPSFAELRSDPGVTGSAADGTTRQQSDNVERHQTFKRNLRFAGGWLPLLAFVVLAVVLTYQLATGGAIDPIHVLWLVMVGVSLLGIGGRGAWKSRRQWLLVPGGVVARRPARKKSLWKLHLFDRRKSVLFLQQEQSNIWRAWVADNELKESVQLTQVEAHTLLCAWLSPLIPPPVEHLSDLT